MVLSVQAPVLWTQYNFNMVKKKSKILLPTIENKDMLWKWSLNYNIQEIKVARWICVLINTFQVIVK